MVNLTQPAEIAGSPGLPVRKGMHSESGLSLCQPLPPASCMALGGVTSSPQTCFFVYKMVIRQDRTTEVQVFWRDLWCGVEVGKTAKWEVSVRVGRAQLVGPLVGPRPRPNSLEFLEWDCIISLVLCNFKYLKLYERMTVLCLAASSRCSRGCAWARREVTSEPVREAGVVNWVSHGIRKWWSLCSWIQLLVWD